MKYHPLGSAEIEASVIGLGTWVTGGGATWGANPDDQESIRAIHKSLDMGINLIDTAPAYGWGRSERVVGQAIKDRRDQVILATKCGLIWDDERGSPHRHLDGKLLRRSLRPDTIREEIEHSLQRLQTDHIDLYQTHWPSIEPDLTALEDTWAVLIQLRDSGKICHIGVCNCSVDQLQDNVDCGPLVSDQLRYSMLNRGAEEEIFPFCQHHRLATLTYMSLEQGLLTGKVGMDREFAEGEFRTNESWNPWYRQHNRRKILELLAGWQDLTDKYECSLAQLVIAWTIQQIGVSHVLIGARNVSQAEENAAAAELEMETDDLTRMRNEVVALGEPG